VSAIELIAQIKLLPPSEQANLARWFEEWRTAAPVAAGRPAAQWPDFMARLRKNFPNGPVPGQSVSSLIDEGRGDF
jgi:hypothetical protein